jgi:uncharacterized damage-inducible protein DinB
MKDHFLRLNEYNFWATKKVAESIRNTLVLDARALELFSHILIAQTNWLDRVSQRSLSYSSPWLKLSIEECQLFSQESYNEWKSYLGNVDEEKLLEIEYKNVKGDMFKNKVSDIITHVFNHSSYHRGQIAQLIRKANGNPAVTDFIAFARL